MSFTVRRRRLPNSRWDESYTAVIRLGTATIQIPARSEEVAESKAIRFLAFDGEKTAASLLCKERIPK